jgi:hypothetical protein
LLTFWSTGAAVRPTAQRSLRSATFAEALHHLSQIGNLPMNPLSSDTLESRVVRLSQAAPKFGRIADELILKLRRAMGVPDQAEADVEEEFAALRSSLDEFYPEFVKVYGGLLLHHLGGDASVVVPALESEPIQAYLQAADGMEAELSVTLKSLASSIGAALGSQPRGC